MPSAIDLTLCMVVKNEERNLPQCLDSIRDLAAELMLVDTGSTDNTVGVARARGAKVIPFDFSSVHFAAARNHSIEHASGRWILVLDADEMLDQTGIAALKTLVAGNENAGYFLERHNHCSDSGATIIDHVVRLFPNHPSYRYHGRVHETIDASILSAGGRLAPTEIRLNHKFISDREMRRRKNRWYIEILKQEIAADPSDTGRLDFLAAEYHQLELYDEAAAIAERIAQLRPNDARAHLFAGTYHLLFKPDLAQARSDFERALAIRPNYPEAQSFLGLLAEREAASGGSPAG